MQKLNIDFEQSIAIAQKYPAQFKTNRCYENVYAIVMNITELPMKDMQVLFCYTHNGEYHFRHAFCIYQDTIIEPLENL